MNTFFTNRLNGVFILNTLLELPQPVTAACLAEIINRRYFHVTAPQPMVSADTVRRFLNDFYQTTYHTDYSCFKLMCFKNTRDGLVPVQTLDSITLSTFVAAYLQPSPRMNIRTGKDASCDASFPACA